jgi:regulator of protease activity HflC (stomatin/prohibitin superfamily)
MQERERTVMSGWLMLPVVILLWLAVPGTLVKGILSESIPWVVAAIILVPVDFLMTWGLFTLQPNEARVLVLFGRYAGTVRKDGFHWANPFSVHRGGPLNIQAGEQHKQPQIAMWRSKYRVSLRARNFETQTLKVNDQRGNPIDIGAVVVWRVEDTARALFDVDEYENYVKVQSETAVRHLANSYPYDHGKDAPGDEITLRHGDAISDALARELQDRLSRAGVRVEEARLTHLAYSPEIAGTMLRRQQAEAIIAARQKIVHGAVSMVEMALNELSEKHVVELDEERKAAMVGNLLVVLCGETAAEPVINAGTLYH